MKKTIPYIILLLTMSMAHTYAQKKVNVITKTIIKDFEYVQQTLFVQGEKSNIQINTWDNSQIKVEIKLISKNYIKSHATRDLDIMKYSIENKNGIIKLKNYFQADEITGINSNLNAEYLIFLPKNCSIKIINLYGSININHAELNGSINNSFGNVELRNIKGSLEFQLHYSDLILINSAGKHSIQASNSDILLENTCGEYILKTSYGNIELTPVNIHNKISINAQRTRINATVRNFNDYNFSLSTLKDEIILPNEYSQLIKIESGALKFNKTSSSNNGSIEISTTYCPITLKTE